MLEYTLVILSFDVTNERILASPMLLTLANVLRSLKELLIVWMNQVLHDNAIYAPEIFLRRSSFDLVVYMSRNPALNQYLEKLVDDFLELLVNGGTYGEGGLINSFSIVLYDTKTDADRERYAFNFSRFINLKPVLASASVSSVQSLLQRSHDSEADVIDIPGFTWDTMFAQYKYLLFQQQCELERKRVKRQDAAAPVSDALFFRVLIDADATLPLALTREWARMEPQEGSLLPRTRVVPVAEIETGFICASLQTEYVRGPPT